MKCAKSIEIFLVGRSDSVSKINAKLGSFNTFDSYSQVVRNHIVTFLGKKLVELNKRNIYKLYQNRAEYLIYIVQQVTQ